MRFRASKTCLGPLNNFPIDRSKAAPQVNFVWFCASLGLYVAFLSLCVHHLSFFWRLGKAVLRYYGISMVYLLIILKYLVTNRDM